MKIEVGMHSLSEAVMEPAAMRQVLRGVAATVHVVAMKREDAAFFATTATAVVSVCLEPPMLALCLNTTGALAKELQEGMLFSVSALTRDQMAVAQDCAGGTPHQDREKFFEPAESTGAPVVSGAQASFACRCTVIVPQGTHVVVFGTVLEAARRECVEPLIYLDARYGGFSPLDEFRPG
ncbi:MAG: flavin reductase family protein [Xanthobacter sp.]